MNQKWCPAAPACLRLHAISSPNVLVKSWFSTTFPPLIIFIFVNRVAYGFGLCYSSAFKPPAIEEGAVTLQGRAEVFSRCIIALIPPFSSYGTTNTPEPHPSVGSFYLRHLGRLRGALSGNKNAVTSPVWQHTCSSCRSNSLAVVPSSGIHACRPIN